MNIIEFCQKVGFLYKEQVFDECGNMYIVLGDSGSHWIEIEDMLEEKDIIIENDSCITAEQLEQLNKVDIQIEEDLIFWDSFIEYPYYQIIGKRITEEQAFDMIRKIDNFFNWYIKSDKRSKRTDEVDLIHLDTKYIDKKGIFEGGWVHKNGVIDGNGTMYKWPDTKDLIYDAYNLASNFPYLDLVVAVTEWSERPYDYKQDKEIENPSLNDIINHLQVGIQIKDGNVKIVNCNDARELFKEYFKLYKEEEQAAFKDMEYLERLVRANGFTMDDIE